MKKKICGIYKISNENGGIYIGQSCDIDGRWYQHKKYPDDANSILGNSIRKYGIENHKFEVIIECERSELNYFEKFYVSHFQTFNTKKGMNLTSGGDMYEMSEETKKKMGQAQMGNKKGLGKKRTPEMKEHLRVLNTGKTMSEESKVKMSQAKTGTKRTEEAKRKQSESTKGEKNYFFGKTHTDETKEKQRQVKLGKIMKEETKEKLRIINTGKVMSPEAIEKTRIAATGRKHSSESKEKISKSLIGNKRNCGKPMKDDSKEKLRIANTGKKHTPEAKKKISDAIKGENHPRYGKTHSEESKEKQRQAKLGKKMSPESVEKSLTTKRIKRNLKLMSTELENFSLGYKDPKINSIITRSYLLKDLNCLSSQTT